MMIKKKSNPWARVKCLVALPIAAVAVAAFARPEVSNELEEISSAKVNELTSIVKTEEVKSVENSSDEKFNLSGQVMEYPSKKPVPGASVLIKGTTMGTLADIDGKFVLPVKKGDVLVVSYVGLQTQQIPIDGATNLVVWMRDDVQSMEEMVVVGYASEEKEQLAKQEEAKEEPQEEVIFQVVEEMPQFPGGMGEAMKFLAKNMKYPVEAQQAKIEGRVIVRFVVGRDGSVSDVEVMRSVSPELDAEAVRVVSMMPKWIPGKQRGKAVAVKYTMPIIFRLQTPEAPKKEETSHTLQVNMKVGEGADMANVDLAKNHLKSHFTGVPVLNPEGKLPLIIVDGKAIGKGTDSLKTISPDQIQSISVLKNEAAKAEYGDDAKDGVIVIETKKKE